MSYSSQTLITATLDGVPLGVFEKRGGGDVEAQPQKRRPGGGVEEKIYPTNQRTAADLVLTRTYERERDHELVRLAETRTGNGVLTATEQLLDGEGAPWGTPKTWKGILNHVTPSDADANSADLRDFVLTATVKVPA